MTRPRDLEAELHPSVITARHLRATADAWPDLLEALDPSNSTPLTGRVTGTSGRPLPINAHVSDVIAEISGWVFFWVRALLDETTDWEPPAEADAPTLLRALAERTGHWTEHPDQALAEAFIEECAQMRRKAEDTAHPRGFRKIPVQRPCPVEGCAGELYAPLSPEAEYLPSLRCSVDRHHTVEPYEWSRPSWRKEERAG